MKEAKTTTKKNKIKPLFMLGRCVCCDPLPVRVGNGSQRTTDNKRAKEKPRTGWGLGLLDSIV